MLDHRVFRLGENLHQRVFTQFGQRGDHRHAPNQLGDQAELDQIFWFDVLERLRQGAGLLAFDNRTKTDARRLSTVFNHLFQPGKSATATEKDVGRIDLQKILIRVLAAALRRHRCHGALDQLEQRLLHAFA